MASMIAPYATRRFSGVPSSQRALPRSSSPLLLLVGTALFMVAAAVLLVPQIAGTFQAIVHPATSTTGVPATSTAGSPSDAAPVVAPLSRADIESVLTYARAMQADDQLVQVRSGVFAKRSNVQGVPVHGATVYYDVLPHQSYGPLRSGRVTESQVNIVSREASDGFMVLVYTLK